MPELTEVLERYLVILDNQLKKHRSYMRMRRKYGIKKRYLYRSPTASKFVHSKKTDRRRTGGIQETVF